MGTTSEELKKLYKKLGGKDPKVAGFSAPGEILNAINEIPLPTEYELPTVTTEDAGDVLVVNEEGHWDKGEASGGLPEVTTDDNGDILQVVEGAWAKAAMSTAVIVYELEVMGAGRKLKNDKHVSDILNDIQSGKYVLLKDTTGNIFASISNTNNQQIEFIAAEVLSDNKTVWVGRYYTSTQNPTTTYNFFFKAVTYDTSNKLPSVNSSDNGNVLTVVDGAWGKAEPSGGETIINILSIGGGNWELENGLKNKDVYQMVQSNQNIIIHADGGAWTAWLRLTYFDGTFYIFTAPYASQSANNFMIICKIANTDDTKVYFASASI